MIKHNPDSIGRPLGAYAHGIEIPGGQRLLYISGQLGYAPDGTLPSTFEGQADRAWQNIREILKSAGMNFSDIVKIGTFVVRPDDYEKARVVRARYLGDHRPASTTVVTSGLGDPKHLIEVEAVATA
jgi:2-iminobutanoate/2-iminopropanoate deaminase